MRQDTSLIDAHQRPLQKEYDRYLYLVEILRDKDYDSRAISQDFPFRVIDIGLNSILQRANLDLKAMLEQFGMRSECQELEARIELTQNAFTKLWDPQHEHFYNRDEFTGELIRVPTSACFLPLFAGLAGNEQVLKMVSTLENWMDQKLSLIHI